MLLSVIQAAFGGGCRHEHILVRDDVFTHFHLNTRIANYFY